MLFMMRENLSRRSSASSTPKTLLDAEEGAGVGGEDYAQGFGAGDVLLVPDVVKRVGLVFQVEEHPGEI